MHSTSGVSEASLIIPVAVSILVFVAVLPVSAQNRRILVMAYSFFIPFALCVLALIIRDNEIRRSLAVISDLLLLSVFISIYMWVKTAENHMVFLCSIILLTTAVLIIINAIGTLPACFAVNAPLTYTVPMIGVLTMFLFRRSDGDRDMIYRIAFLFVFSYILDAFSAAVFMQYPVFFARSLAYILFLFYFIRQSRKFRKKIRLRRRADI